MARSGLADGLRPPVITADLGRLADPIGVRWSPTAPKLLTILPLDEEEDEVYV